MGLKLKLAAKVAAPTIESNTNDREAEAKREETVTRICKAMSSWYVRKDGKYFSVDRLNVKLSKYDVELASMQRIKEEFGDLDVSHDILKRVFERTIVRRHFERDQMIPVWSGAMVCNPGNSQRYVWVNGMVDVNTWSEPAYRANQEAEADYGIAGEFIDVFFTRKEEKDKFLDWLSWCLQNEGAKPAWAPLFYSETKGSGKSTLCKLASRLFGESNSAVVNSVDKLTSKFNSPILRSKLIISEEVQLRTDSPQSNSLKTYITEIETVTERKGVDAERIKQYCCFLFTTNHLPLWIEAEDRRYYLIEVDHDGHATGQKAQEFAALVESLYGFMENDAKVAALYRALMERKQAPDFNAKTLNVVEDATPLMKRVQGASEATRKAQLREYLQEKGLHALPEANAIEVIKTELDGNISSTKHLMTELGWSKDKVKWGGLAFAKAVWVEKGYWAERGKIKGPEGFEEELGEHFKRLDRFLQEIG